MKNSQNFSSYLKISRISLFVLLYKQLYTIRKIKNVIYVCIRYEWKEFPPKERTHKKCETCNMRFVMMTMLAIVSFFCFYLFHFILFHFNNKHFSYVILLSGGGCFPLLSHIEFVFTAAAAAKEMGNETLRHKNLLSKSTFLYKNCVYAVQSHTKNWAYHVCRV